MRSRFLITLGGLVVLGHACLLGEICLCLSWPEGPLLDAGHAQKVVDKHHRLDTSVGIHTLSFG